MTVALAYAAGLATGLLLCPWLLALVVLFRRRRHSRVVLPAPGQSQVPLYPQKFPFARQ